MLGQEDDHMTCSPMFGHLFGTFSLTSTDIDGDGIDPSIHSTCTCCKPLPANKSTTLPKYKRISQCDSLMTCLLYQSAKITYGIPNSISEVAYQARRLIKY